MFNLTRTHKLSFFILIEILLIYLLYILKATPGASGYEASIYAAYPNTFWVIYFLIYLLSLSAVVYSIFIKSDKLFFFTGLFNLLILNSIILLLPFLRGYFTIGIGDVTNHLAYLKGILSTHYWGGPEVVRGSPYPLPHILSVDMMLIIGMKLETIGQITPVLYYIVYVLFVYLLGRELFKDNRKAILLLLVALVPVLRGYYYYPSLMFFCLIPMLLYALAKTVERTSFQFKLVLVITLVTLPIAHAASSVLLMAFSAIICLVVYILPGGSFTLRSYLNCALIFLVVWFVWLLALEGTFVSWIRYYVGWFSSVSEQYSYFKVNLAGLEAARLSLGDAIILYIKKFGPTHLLFGLASVFSISAIYNWIRKKRYDKFNIALSIICLVSVALYIISFFFTLTLLGGRIIPYVLLISLLVSATFLFSLVSASKSRIRRVVSLTFTVVLLFSITCIATFGYYDSPFTKDSPEHCTYMELNGMSWLLQNRNKNLEVDDLSHKQRLLTTCLLGYDKSALEPNLKSVYELITMPHHFNYGNESLLAKTLKKNMYLIINKKTELISTEVYPEYEDRWVFHPDDYAKLESDVSIDRMYHNGEVKIFFVNGEKWSEGG